MRLRRIWPFFILLVFLTVIICLFARDRLNPPPIARLNWALKELTDAQAVQADIHAPTIFYGAQSNLKIGEQELHRISTDWWPFGSYQLADSLLNESIRLSKQAVSASDSTQASAAKSIKLEYTKLTDSLRQWGDVLDNNLSHTDWEEIYHRIEFQLKVAGNLVNGDSPEGARAYLKTARNLFGALVTELAEYKQVISQTIGQTRQWASETVKYSKNGGKMAIIVDKSRHMLYVLKSGHITDSCYCDLGYNSSFQKKRASDGATPEGMYRVTEKKRWSKYYRALLLNYPNDSDKIRFRKNLSSGEIPAGSKIGGLIEIHGHGFRNKDWTEGCVAVSNDEMDRLFQIASVGTPVTIVRTWDNRR